jgi:alkylhydroperoxidase family enzyme
MHWKDLEVLGETRSAATRSTPGRECPYYSERERAALAWAEAVTRVAEHQVPDAVYRGRARTLQ